MPFPIMAAISGLSAGAGLLGSLFGGGKNDYDKMIDQIISGQMGGIPPDLMKAMSEMMRSDISKTATTQRARTTEDLNTRGLYQSGILNEQMSDINESELDAVARSMLGLQMQDAQMRNQLLGQVVGMGNPQASQNDMWGNLMGSGLQGLLFSQMGGGGDDDMWKQLFAMMQGGGGQGGSEWGGWGGANPSGGGLIA